MKIAASASVQCLAIGMAVQLRSSGYISCSRGENIKQGSSVAHKRLSDHSPSLFNQHVAHFTPVGLQLNNMLRRDNEPAQTNLHEDSESEFQAPMLSDNAK